MKSRNTISVRVTFLIIAALVLFVGGWVWWTDAVSPIDPSDTNPILFSITRGEGVRTISANLAQNRLIRSPTGFFLLVKLLGFETQLQAGDFRLNRGMDAHAIANELTHGIADAWVTTLEGWRVEEIATKLAKDLDIPEGEFLKVAREGYMFPDTYLVPRDATVGAVAELFLLTFDQRMDEKIRTDAKKTGLSFDEVVTLASIVEREGRTEEDRPVIAGILLKRLKADWPLQADATLQYALGYQAREKTWWKKVLFEEDKKTISPYNTYLNAGLPPGPIANPSLASVKAVINPQETNYWYYLHDPEGLVHYGRTLEEHNSNIARYLR